MTTATAQANPNIAFIKLRLAKLGRTNGLNHGITRTPDDVVPAVVMPASMDGVQVIRFTYYGH